MKNPGRFDLRINHHPQKWPIKTQKWPFQYSQKISEILPKNFLKNANDVHLNPEILLIQSKSLIYLYLSIWFESYKNIFRFKSDSKIIKF